MELLSYFDIEGMNQLRADFMKKPDGLLLKEFISVALTRLPQTGLSDIVLVRKLKNLFEQVDVNDDGIMEWEEFSGFCIEMGMAATVTQQLELSEKYVEREFKDTTSHTPSIPMMKYIPEVEKLFVCEEANGSVKVYDPNKKGCAIDLLHEICPFEVEGRLNDQEKAKQSVLCIEFFQIDDQNYLVTSDTNLSLTFWDAAPYEVATEFPPRYLMRVSTSKPQILLCWAEGTNYLFSAAAENFITCWRVEVSQKFTLTEVSKLRKHSDLIQSIVFAPEYDLLVTAALDCKIYIWEFDSSRKEETKWYWKGERLGHKKGVRSLSYAEEGVVLSAAFDLVILVWDIAGQSKSPLMRLMGHVSPLMAVRVLPSKQHALSIDISGIMKTWDIRRDNGINDGDRAIQTFSKELLLPGAKFQPTSITVTSPQGSIVTGTSKLHIWDSVQIRPQNFPPVSCLYNPVSMTIVCAVGKDVKIWCAKNGILLSHFQNVTHAEITSLQLDFRHRKFIVADQKGGIVICNYMNGSPMKENVMTVRGAELSCIVYDDEDKVFIAAGWDKTIRIYDETHRERLDVLRTLNHAHSSNIITIAFSHELSLIASGAEDGSCRLWDFQFLSCEGDIKLSSSITCLEFVKPFPLLLSADENGYIKFWLVRPWGSSSYGGSSSIEGKQHKRNHCVASFQAVFNSVITCIQVKSTRRKYLLYVGDDSGYLYCYDITNVLIDLGVSAMPSDLSPVSLSNYNPMRKLSRDQRNIPQSSLQKHATLNIVDDSTQVPITVSERKHCWKAHSKGVQSIQFVDIPETLLSCSIDKTIKLWSTSGKELGVLDSDENKSQLSRRERIWEFPIDLKKRENQEINSAGTLLRNIMLSKRDELSKDGFELPPAAVLESEIGCPEDKPETRGENSTDNAMGINLEPCEEQEPKDYIKEEIEIATKESNTEAKIEESKTSKPELNLKTTQVETKAKDSAQVESSISDISKQRNKDATEPFDMEKVLAENGGLQLTELLKRGEKFRIQKKKEESLAMAAKKAEWLAISAAQRQANDEANNETVNFESVLDSVVSAQRGRKQQLPDRERAIGQLMGKVTWIKTQQELAQDTVLKLKKKQQAKDKLAQLHEIGDLDEGSAKRKKTSKKKKKKNGKGKGNKKQNNSNPKQKSMKPKPSVAAFEEKPRVTCQEYKYLFEENHRAEMKEMKRKGESFKIMQQEMSPMVRELVEKEASKKKMGFLKRKSMDSRSKISQGISTNTPGDSTDWRDIALKVKLELELGFQSKKDKSNISNQINREQDDQHKTKELERLETLNSMIDEQSRSLIKKEKKIELEKRVSRSMKRKKDVERRKSRIQTLIQISTKPTDEQLERISNRQYFGPYSKMDLYYARHIFQSVDTNKDGIIDLKEYQVHMNSSGTKEGKFRALIDRSSDVFNFFDEDGSGALSVEEMAGLLFKKANRQEMSDIIIFLRQQKIVSDIRTRNLNCRKMSQMYSDKIQPTRNFRVEIQRLFDLYDSDEDGKLSREEFIEAIERNTHMFQGIPPVLEHKDIKDGYIDFELFYEQLYKIWV